MPIIIDTCDQRSEQWFTLRAGNVGASNVSKIITSTGAISKQRDDFLLQLAAETITGRCEDSYTSQAMQTGIEREDEAISLFALIYGVTVQKAGIIFQDERRLFHASPDGIINNSSVIEVKCPAGKTATKYLLDGRLPAEYFPQVMMHLYVTGFDLCYFMSYYPGLPPFIIEVQRDEPYIAKLEKALFAFTTELKEIIKRIREMK